MNLDKLLGALAQSGMGRASGGAGVDIGGILSQVLGGGGMAAAPAGRSGGGMGGLGGLLEGLGGGGSSGGGLGGILGGLAGGQRGGGGGLGGGMGGGLMAIIATIAMQALQNRGGGAASLSAPPASASNDVAPGSGGGGFLDMADSVGGGTRAAPLMGQDTAQRIIRTMIAAAAADGTIDEAEATAIQGHLGEDDAEERAFIEQELNNPATPEQLADGVGGPQEAAQVYTAALLTVTMDSPEESRFLKQLALALGLDAQTIASLHQTVRQG
ncbi:DUF533 domain-containing protein [Mycobacterium sp. KBS0706]|uniref:tellurite resistance TerB family protein n=1 Tax=Mycobacterium sp. KBS0706 TaxID=2578109 RepID=UPI00110FD238|nr:DUF533 domain-containing protein [Mycobacterium sp. KBS0706]TSD88063.1 DUF533 domain-containing protein [Mycobacterium sp. KBS0706]